MDHVAEIADLMRSVRRILFITGAGISADSGLPTYRGIGGLYDGQVTEEGINIEDALSGRMLALHPEITWKYLGQIEKACRGKGPNAAHEVIALLQNDWQVDVITQNIDGFHIAAGSHNVIEMHGNMHGLRCHHCHREREVRDYSQIALPPRCPACGAPERPAVVLFGEMLPEQALEAYYRVMAQGVDMVFSVGTSSVFPYISGPVQQAVRQGIPTVEINPGRTQLSESVDFHVPERAAVFLPALWQILRKK